MKMKISPKTIEQLLEPYPIVEEGSENLSSIEPSNEPEIILPRMVIKALENAKQGEPKAWAILYDVCAFYLIKGMPLVEPLRVIMADRMKAIGHALSHPRNADLRAGLLSAVAPMPANKVRLVGTKSKVMKLDALAVDVLQYKDAGLSLKAAARKVEAMLPINPETGLSIYPASSLEASAKRIRKQQRDAEEQRKTQ